MDGVIEYGFGTGDEMSSWRSPADLDLDGDSVLDAVALDFDGDGLVDDAMWDTDGDGVADRSVLDLDDDGVPETQFADGGSGLWERPVDGSAGPRESEPDAQKPDESVLDTDGDGEPDTVLIDTDGDGYADAHRSAGDR
ncbi:hypothetical protein L5G28_02725 [Gordonia sp. HY285]|uniref:hypothetical protein n=1 Tax=Gordonia liuliyuniae TaxID=2911517 RepID=UPI001F48578F|nr:hypothetical protein [Gordonia liuliyuniae]MCF8609078.1 hypothetical protein [Gordonia liuliyuniae]